MNRKALIAFFVLTTVFAASCTADVKYTKQVNVKVPAGQAEAFAAETHNGNITITGCQTTDCNLTAVITVKAGTEEAAKKIAEEIKISLLPEGNSINVKIEKPDTSSGVQINIDLNANLPAGMNLSLTSHNGNIVTTDTSGGVKASTHNGNISHKGASADLKFESHNGDIDIQCKGQSAKPCEINAKTHNGSIEFAAPENFSAAIDISTHSGSIHTDLPIAITEKTDEKLEGVIGDGRDKLHIETHNGSIKIKYPQTRKEINMLPQILASTGGEEMGFGHFVMGSWPFIIGALPFIMIIAIVAIVFRFLINKKRLEHQQIMAAIEKGTPLSELRPVKQKGPNWIINLSAGIGLSLMGLGLITVLLFTSDRIFSFGDTRIGLFLAVIFLAVGTARIIRGILQRKADKASSSDNSALDANHGQ